MLTSKERCKTSVLSQKLDSALPGTSKVDAGSQCRVSGLSSHEINAEEKREGGCVLARREDAEMRWQAKKALMREKVAVAVGEVKVVSDGQVAAGLYPRASSNEI